MTPEEAVAHKAQEQFDEYEREIAALSAELAVRKRMRARFEQDSVTHNPKPDWTVTHPRSTTCPWCSEPDAEGLPTSEREAEMLLLTFQQNARYEDYHERNVRTLVAFIEGLRIAATPPAEGLDVERLAAALRQFDVDGLVQPSADGHYRDMAEAIAREYAALAPEQPE